MENWGEVNLITRPRRFGKSLNMSMLKSFFEIGGDATRFEWLKILQEKELCERYMGKFPVISISLKSVAGLDYETASVALRHLIGIEAMRLSFLEVSEQLSADEKKIYRAIVDVEKDVFSMTDDILVTSLQVLTQLLEKHYGCKVILLIDEYDVPLDKAFQAGYYEKTVSLVRNLFGSALKSNGSLFLLY